MNPLPITLPARPKVPAPAPEPVRLESFPAFIDAVRVLMQSYRARLDRHAEDAEGASWWLLFYRAPCEYRINCDRRAELITIERSLGSFVPNSQPGWRLLESRPFPDPDFEVALELVKGLLSRFGQS